MPKETFDRKRRSLCRALEKNFRNTLVKSYISSVLLYGAETYTLRKKKKKIRSNVNVAMDENGKLGSQMKKCWVQYMRKGKWLKKSVGTHTDKKVPVEDGYRGKGGGKKGRKISIDGWYWYQWENIATQRNKRTEQKEHNTEHKEMELKYYTKTCQEAKITLMKC